MPETSPQDATRDRRDSGYSLVEMIVAMSIFTGLLVVVFTVLVQVTRQTSDNMARTRQVEQLRVGLMQIDRQVRSGNVISDPALETVAGSGVEPGYSLRVYTQADGVFQCAQWRVVFDGSTQGRLEYRSWDPAWQSTGLVEPWRVVARDLVDQRASDPAAAAPFSNQVAGGGSEAQAVRVTLWLKDAKSDARSKAATVSSVLTGRNTVFGYPADECSTIPAP